MAATSQKRQAMEALVERYAASQEDAEMDVVETFPAAAATDDKRARTVTPRKGPTCAFCAHPGATRGLDACLTSTLWRPPDGSLVFVLNKLHKKQTGRWQRSENGGVVWSPDGAPFSPTRVVFVLGFVSLINFLISGKKQMSCLF